MVDLMDKSAIIKLKKQGYSNRKVEKMLKINRKTIAKYWNESVENVQKLNTANDTLSKYNSDILTYGKSHKQKCHKTYKGCHTTG